MGVSRFVVFLMLLGSSARAEPDKLQLGWGHTWDRYYKQIQCKAYRDPPEGVDALDEDDLWYVSVELAPGRNLLAATQAGAKPPRAWIDLDMDGQLTDEEPVELAPHFRNYKFSFEIPWREGTKKAPHPLPAELVFQAGEEKAHAWLRIKGHRQLQLVLEGRLRWIVALSGNADLKMDDADVDHIYVDLDGDGRIQTGAKSHERVWPGIAFRAGRRGYVLKLTGATGAELELSRAESAPPPRARPWPAPKRIRRPYASNYTVRDDLSELIDRYRKGAKSKFGVRSAGYQLRRIGGVGSAAAVNFLLGVARKDPEPAMRLQAAQALKNMRNAPHASRITAAAKSARDPEIARELVRTVYAMTKTPEREELLLALLDGTRHDEVRETAAELLASGGPAWRKRLRESVGNLRKPATDYYAYRAGTRFETSPPDELLLTRALESKGARLRLLAYADVAWLGMRDTRPFMIALLFEELKRGRMSAELARLTVRNLGPVAGVEEIPLLFGVMPAGTLETRNHLVDLLRLVRDEAAIAVIRAQLDDKRAAVRGLAVRVLAELPGDANGEALAAQLARERDATVRLQLVNALGKGGVRSAAPTLIKLSRLGNRDERMQEAARIALARIGFEAPEVAAYFERQAEARDWITRLDAVDVAARYSGKSAVAFLAGRLEDKEWRVRMAAARGLGRIRTKECISPLIAVLESEEDGRVRRAVADALFRVTGQHLYDMYKLWVKWWSRNHGSFVVSPVVPTKKKQQGDRRTVADFYGVPVESEQVVFVIDQSGSMGGRLNEESELDRAVKEMLKVVRRMRNSARINVIFFESGIQLWSKKLRKLDKKTRNQLKGYVESQRPTGGTNLYDGLETAMKIRDVDTVYLLSDGSPSAGTWTAEEDILREIGKLNKRLRIQIHCVSLGRDSSLLRNLAEQSGGTYVRR